MADLTITAANVDRVTGSQRTQEAGVAITAGDAVYQGADGLVALAEKDLTVTESLAQGIALSDAAIGQPVTYQISGVIALGATLSAGEVYMVGAGPGGIAPVADVGTGDFATILGIAVSAANLKIGIIPSGVAAA